MFNASHSHTVQAHRPTNVDLRTVMELEEVFPALVRASNVLAKSSRIIECAPGVFYAASYIGVVAKHLAAAIGALIGPKDAVLPYKAWLEGQVPVGNSPVIELTPREAIQYTRKALQSLNSPESASVLNGYGRIEMALTTSAFKHFFCPKE